MWHRYAKPFTICLVYLLQQICCLPQAHPPQWPPSLALSYKAWRRRQFSTNQRPRNYLRYTDRQTENQHNVRPCSMSSAFKKTHETRKVLVRLTHFSDLTHMHVHFHTYIFSYTLVLAYLDTCILVYLLFCILEYLYTFIYACILAYMQILAYSHTCILAYGWDIFEIFLRYIRDMSRFCSLRPQIWEIPPLDVFDAFPKEKKWELTGQLECNGFIYSYSLPMQKVLRLVLGLCSVQKNLWWEQTW